MSEHKCDVLTNFVRLRKLKDVSVYEYRLSFPASVATTKLKKSVLIQLQSTIGPVHNFDGETLYLPCRLTNEVTVLNCCDPTMPSKDVQVTIKFIKQKPFEELTQFFNILFKRILIRLGFLEIRRGYYEMSTVRVLQEHKLQVWPGVALTVEEKEGGLAVMIDSPSRILRTDTLYDHFVSMKKKHGSSDSDSDANLVKEFTDFAIGKIVLCKYSNQCYKIDDISFTLYPTAEFNYKSGLMTYLDYYKMQYDITIKDHEQPLLFSKIKPRKTCNPNESVRVVALVPELCYLTGLTSDHRMNYKIMSEISTITRLCPALKLDSMRVLIRRIIDSSEAQTILEKWGIAIEDDVMSVVGRKIEGPKLSFSKRSSKVVESDFSKESNSSCYEPVPVDKFLVICTRREVNKVANFITYYKLACTTVGIKMTSSGQIVPLKDSYPSSFIKALDEYVDLQVQFVIIVTPGLRDDVYAAVKKYCLSSTRPIPSQCILSKTLGHKAIRTVALKICLQINCKLGGALWALRLPVKKVMFLGMDAAHDPTRKNPSVIALVASVNDSCTKYFSRCSLQSIHQEVATSLRVMFIDALKAYKKHNGGELPHRIIFFRDGGCAGTFEVLKKYEVEVCIEVLKEQSETHRNMPAFSYICVAKRIPERLLLRTEGKYIMNPPPGVIVDTGITQPSLYDFYCVSQQARQGTANPTHYTILYETQRTEPDQMQKFAYVTTFMYYNWQGSIRVPAFVQYAHKLGQLVSRVKVVPNRQMSNELYFL